MAEAVQTSDKRRHALAAATDAAAFRHALAADGIDVARIVGAFVAPGAPHGVLLGGSLAEGKGTPESDVDLLVLLESRADLRAPAADVKFTSGRSIEFLHYEQGIEFNLEFVCWRDLAPLLNALVDMAPALYDPSLVESLPLLEYSELRFLHRLRTGWPLIAPEIVARWSDELLVGVLPTYLTLRHYLFFFELIEDAWAARNGPPGAVAHTGRLAVEFAVLSLLAHAGRTNQNRRWLLQGAADVHDGRVRPVLDEALELLFPARHASTRDALLYLRAITRLGPAMDAAYSADPELRRGMSYLRSKIHYVEEQD